MQLLEKKEDCCGCRTCEKVCPKQAIVMKKDEGGFLYPEIDADKCIDCGLCLKKCAFQSGYKTRKEFETFYGFGARHKEEHILKKSRSGGAFVALSSKIIDEGGSIYGVGYDEEQGFFYVRHKRATTKRSRNEFRGSKYVQSDLGDVFPQIKEELEAGKTVLFSGTGCQVGALYSYLPKEYENLYTIDIVCHGAPSPQIWSDYLHMREEEYQGKITRVNFRDKNRFGWKAHRETVVIGKKRVSGRVYSKLYQKKLITRPSCFKCVYTNTNRPSDITIADFWGHEDAIPGKWDDDRGISLVLVNNAKGLDLWNKAKENLEWVECTGYPFRHVNLKRPTDTNELYDEFWEDYKQHGFVYCAEKYVGYTMKKRVDTTENNKPAVGNSEATVENSGDTTKNSEVTVKNSEGTTKKNDDINRKNKKNFLSKIIRYMKKK